MGYIHVNRVTGHISATYLKAKMIIYYNHSHHLPSWCSLGWSTSVPTYNPREIISNLRLMIAGEDPLEMHPWYRGFKGNIGTFY